MNCPTDVLGEKRLQSVSPDLEAEPPKPRDQVEPGHEKRETRSREQPVIMSYDWK